MDGASLSLSLKRLRGGGLGESAFTGDSGRYVKKVSRWGHLSPWGPLFFEGNLVCGGGAHTPGTLTDEWRALVAGHLSARDSIKGTLREGSFTGEPER